jgi:hypothetical protein
VASGCVVLQDAAAPAPMMMGLSEEQEDHMLQVRPSLDVGVDPLGLLRVECLSRSYTHRMPSTSGPLSTPMLLSRHGACTAQYPTARDGKVANRDFGWDSDRQLSSPSVSC